MRYLVTQENLEPFFAYIFNVDNQYRKGMTVYDLNMEKYFDGEKWQDIKIEIK